MTGEDNEAGTSQDDSHAFEVCRDSFTLGAWLNLETVEEAGLHLLMTLMGFTISCSVV